MNGFARERLRSRNGIESMSTDLTFLTNEPGKTLRDRFHVLLTDHTRCFDCLVGYFYVSGFFRLYRLLDCNRQAFVRATTYEEGEPTSLRRGGTNETYVLKRLKAREIRQCQTYTEDDEEFIRQIIALVEEGALPRPTTRKVAEALTTEIEPLKVLAHLRRNIPIEFLRSGYAHRDHGHDKPREVILSSVICGEDE